VEMAQRFGMTLIGFARDRKFNVYCGESRLSPTVAQGTESP
jgi:formate dehydrogenase assembly factor FdhD